MCTYMYMSVFKCVCDVWQVESGQWSSDGDPAIYSHVLWSMRPTYFKNISPPTASFCLAHSSLGPFM